jgi:outer membrane murein-binding lipoprotein Lpp
MVAVGCNGGGVSEEDYNAVVAERDALKAQVTNLQGDLNATQEQLGTLQDKVAIAAKYADLLTWHRGPKGEMSEMELMAEWQNRLEALGDPELSAIFGELMEDFQSKLAQGLTPEEIAASPEHQAIHMRGCDYITHKIATLLGVESELPSPTSATSFLERNSH